MNLRMRIACPLRACVLMALLASTSSAAGPQQAEIHALVKELDYLIEYAERLARQYGDDTAPVRFNYSQTVFY